MNCGQWEERLALYASGDLSLKQAGEAERHLAECPGCQLFTSGLKESLEILAQAHLDDPGPAHFAAVRARVLSQLERERRPFWRRGWVLGLAAVAATLIMLLAAGLGPNSPVPPPPMVALAHPAPPPPVASPAPLRLTPRPRAVGKGEDIVVKLVSPDPDIVIYWIAETKGE